MLWIGSKGSPAQPEEVLHCLGWGKKALEEMTIQSSHIGSTKRIIWDELSREYMWYKSSTLASLLRPKM